MTSEEKSETTISGPINVVRLEGEVFGIKKVLYVFFDIHYHCTMETKCENIFSDTITTYLIKQFKEVRATKIDFFLETFPSELIIKGNISRDKYIIELRKLLSQSFAYDPEKGEVLPSKMFPYVRLHYIDVRDYLFENTLVAQPGYLNFIFRNMYNAVLIYNNTSIDNDIKKFREELNIFNENINKILNLFFGQKGGKQTKIIKQRGEKISEEERHENTVNLIKKIKEGYSHPEVKKIISLMLHEYLERGLVEILHKIDKINKLLEKLSKLIELKSSLNPIKPVQNEYTETPEFMQMARYGVHLDDVIKIIVDISFLMNSMYDISTSTSVTIVDTYFLRRFLDKDYITNGISYTGTDHSNMYIYILTKYFGFEITHASYSKYNIDEINDIVKKTNIGYDFSVLFTPPESYQCSNITNFPEGFS